jgi:uncharacterized protein YkvS
MAEKAAPIEKQITEAIGQITENSSQLTGNIEQLNSNVSLLNQITSMGCCVGKLAKSKLNSFKSYRCLKFFFCLNMFRFNRLCFGT